MASIYQSKTVTGQPWIVSIYLGKEDGKRRSKTKRFPTRELAEQYLRTLSTEAGPGKRGRAPRSRAQIIDYLAANFEVSDDECWLWTGPLQNAGYARATWRPIPGGEQIPGGHRVVLHALGFPIPEGLVVDHLCRVRHCINPDHLEPVVQRENIMRSPIAPGALNAAKTHCAKGHEYTPENTATYVNPGGRTTVVRVCKTCQRAWSETAHARRAQKGAAA